MKRRAIRSISKKRQDQLVERKVLRERQLRAKPRCEAQLNHCSGSATDVHEIINRSQRATSWLEPQYFLSLCRRCHGWITTHPMWSRHHGFTLSAYRHEDHWIEAARKARAGCNDQTCQIDHLEGIA